MANLHDCLQRAVDAGELDQIHADEAKSEFDQLVERYEQAMPRHQAEATAAAHLKEATKRARRSRRHSVLNQLQSMVRLNHLMMTSPDPALALRNLIEFSEGSGFTGESIQSVFEAYVTSINAGLNDMLRDTGRNVIGNSRNAALLREVMQELHGQPSGNPRATHLADAVRGQQKRMRQAFNAYGGDIGEIADYGIAHSHSVALVRRAKFDDWLDVIASRLDWHRMIDLRTDQPFSAKGARPDPVREREFLDNVYRGIVTQGINRLEPSMVPGGKALYNRRADPRILHFRDGDAWMEYNDAFGDADPFTAMIGQLHGMARDVAQMRVLGPNPRMGLEYATQVARKRAVDASNLDLEKRVEKMGKRSATMLAHVDGSANNVYAEGWARFLSNTRKVLVSAQLGSAVLSSVTDVQTMRMAASVMGMKPNNVMARHVQLMASSATRESAARLGYVASTLANSGSASARFLGDVVAGEVADRLSDFTLRATGLSFWTDQARVAVQMEMAGFMAENAGRSFDAIDAPLRAMFETRGITPADWDLLRAPDTLFRTEDGADFLSPIHWLEHQTTLPRAEAEGLAMRVQMMVQEQMERAVPSATIEGRSIVTDAVPAGTILGEAARSMFMYKSFPISLMLNQIRRFMIQPGAMSKTVYAARILVGMSVLGGLAVQLKELTKGNDPRPMNGMKFWAAATAQGGGLGIFGDFFSAKQNRAGGGFAQTMAGPVVGLADDIGNLALNPAHRLIDGRAPLIGRDLSNLVRHNTPFLSSAWYTRLAFDRLVADQMQLLLDPEADAAMRSQMRRRSRDYGVETYWDRRTAAPHRLPDLSNITGGNR